MGDKSTLRDFKIPPGALITSRVMADLEYVQRGDKLEYIHNYRKRKAYEQLNTFYLLFLLL